MENEESYRLTGKSALREAIKCLRKRANNYEAILNSIPDDLTSEADTGLWEMAINIRD